MKIKNRKKDIIQAKNLLSEFKIRIKNLTNAGFNPPKRLLDDIDELEKNLKKSSVFKKLWDRKFVIVSAILIIFIAYIFSGFLFTTIFFNPQYIDPPIADAGGPYFGSCNESIILDCSGSFVNDENSHYIDKYRWDFNDDGDPDMNWTNFSDSTYPYSYPTEGVKFAKLEVMDDKLSTSIDRAMITIYKTYPPTALAGGPYFGYCGNDITFNCSESYDKDENGSQVVKYRWDWTNNGTWDTGWIDFSNPLRMHSYSSLFDGHARIEVVDDENETNTSLVKVTVNCSIPPTANAGGPYSGDCGIPITFDCSGSHDNDEDNSSIEYYRWDWTNDGNWDTGWIDFSNPITTYSYLNEFYGLAKVEVVDNEGATATDITGITINCINLNEGLVGYWSFDDSNEVGHDYSNEGNHGTNYGATWISEGKSNGALSFDGDDFLVVPNNSSLNTNISFSVVAWFKPAIFSPYRSITLITRRGPGYQYSFSIYDHYDDDNYCFYGMTEHEGEGLINLYSEPDYIELDNWYFGVYTYDGSDYRLYLGNEIIVKEVDNNIGSKVQPPSMYEPLVFGRNKFAGGFFNGTLDEVRIYNRALNFGEIEMLFG